MAKKNNDGEEKAGSKVLSAIIVLLIILVWIVILGALIKFDVGGFGSSVLRPVLKDVPVINKILPAASDEEVIEESDIAYDNMKDALEHMSELEKQNVEYAAKIQELTEQTSELSAEVDRLKVFESNQQEFQQKKDEFYNEIVYGEQAPDADTYIEWYNSIDAAAAEEIYRQVLGDKKVSQDILDMANTYSAMKPDAAAKVLEQMSSDLDTVAKILSAMSAEDRGKIMAQMDASFAANVTKKLMP